MEKKTAIKLRRTILIFWVLLSIIALALTLYLRSACAELQGILQKGVLIFIGISFVTGGINTYLTYTIKKSK